MVKTRSKLDPKTKILHVWPTSIPVFFPEIKKKHPKAADLDEIFGRKEKKEKE